MKYIIPIELISESYIKDDLKQQIPAKTYKKVFASKKSAKQSEFFNAAAAGLRSDCTFIIRFFEYNGQKLLRYPAGEDGRVYKIYRTFETDDGGIELYCEVKAGG